MKFNMLHHHTLKGFAALVCLAGIASQGQLHAQKKSPPYSTKLSVLTFVDTGKISMLRWLKANGEIDEGRECRVLISSSSILHPVNYSGPREMTLCSLKPKTDTGDEKNHTPLARVKLPNSRHTLVLLLPQVKGKAADLPYRAVAIDSAIPRFENGCRYLFNFTHLPIRGIMGKTPFDPKAKDNKRFTIKGGGSAILTPLDSNAPAGTGRQIYIGYRNTDTGEWNRMVSSRWFRTPGKRKFVFFYLGTQSATPLMKIVAEAAPLPDQD